MQLLAEISFKWQNMIDAQGPMRAIVGMGIVFTALAFISAFIAVLPYLVGSEANPPKTPSSTPRTDTDDSALAAAIGFVLHAEKENK